MSSNCNRRLKSLLAVAMVGEGVVVALIPRRYARLWLVGPPPLRRLDAWLIDHPNTSRLLGGVEAGLGLLLAMRQRPAE